MIIPSADREADSTSLPEAAVIIGGGIGGLTLANALQAVGMRFELYEQAGELTEVGAGIGLTRGVLDLYDAIGLGDDLRSHGTPIHYLCLADRHLNVRRRMRASHEAICIHRAALIDVLKSRLSNAHIHLGKKATAVNSQRHHAEISFQDGSAITSACVVAADGINSAVRTQLFPEIQVRYIDQTIWRGITRMEVPDVFAESYIEIWDERLRFLTVPYGDSIFWLAVQAAPPGQKDDPTTVREDLLELFDGWHPALKDMIRNSESLIRNDMADLGTAPRPWHHNRVVFLGDAIHATTPNLAQGGCQAIEDAVCLALSLKSFPSDLGRAFDTYQRLRQKKVDFVVRTSWNIGKAAHTRNPLVHHLYRAILERAPAGLIRRQERFLSNLDYLTEVDPTGIVRSSAA
jgi:2-polyprenyl-6-methoxyphenol hydroxylase-like FAD-dependent oxidoreductase